jgi:hypothetical protein
VTLQREELHARFMDGVAENPEKYSPVVVVALPDVDELAEGLVGRKIEVRLKVSGDEPVWTSEGAVMKFASKTSKAKDRWNMRHKCAIVWVKWDVEFANNGEGYANEMPIALKDGLYAKEKAHIAHGLELAY